MTYTKKIGGENISVTYSKEGYPDFSPYSHPEHSKPVEINMTGNNHSDVHDATIGGFPHTGGGSIVRNN